MSEQIPTPVGGDVTSDDKLWAALAYVFSPIVPIILMLMEDKKNRPFIKAHNMQALVLGVIEVLLSILIGWTMVGLCLPGILWLVMLYWAYQAYQGKYITIPVVTDFCKKQGWA